MVTETNFAAWPQGAQDELVQNLTDAFLERSDSEDLDLRALLDDPRLGRFALLSSFGAESVVMIHLVTSLRRDTPVLFLDTGQHFPEPLAYVEHVRETLLASNPEDRVVWRDLDLTPPVDEEAVPASWEPLGNDADEVAIPGTIL